MNKIVSAIVLTLSTIFFINPTQAQAATTYQIIGVGDSIGKMVFPGVGVGQSRWLNSEAARAPNLPGIAPAITCTIGCANSALVASILQGVQWSMAASRPGGYVIVQDGGSADKNGKSITLTEWTNFVKSVLSAIPDDRTLVFIYPAYDPVVSQSGQDVMYNRTIAARELIWASNQPYVTVNWWYAVETHDQNSATPYTNADGLHPSPAGIAWLQQQLNAAVS